MRLTFGLLAAAATGAVGAVVLGEYPYRGWTVLAAGVLFGLFIAEAALAVTRGPSRPLGAGGTVVGLTAMTWGAWIASGHALSYLGPAGWTAVVLTGLVSGFRTSGLAANRFKGGWLRRGSGSPAAEPAPAALPEDPTR